MSRNVTNEYNILWCNHTYLLVMLCQLSVIPQSSTIKHMYGILWTKVPIFISEAPFRFLTWLRITECGKSCECSRDVQRMVRLVSYLHLSPG